MLKKVQNLPKVQKKIILWTLVIIISILLLIIFIKNAQKKIGNSAIGESSEGMKWQELQEQLRNLPKIEMPDITPSEEDIKELEEFENALNEAATGSEATTTQ